MQATKQEQDWFCNKFLYPGWEQIKDRTNLVAQLKIAKELQLIEDKYIYIQNEIGR